jgi:hypothetical protein
MYFLCDVSLVSFFGGDYKKKLWTWLLSEQLSQRSYRGDRNFRLNYYRNSKGSILHLVIEEFKVESGKRQHLTAIKIFDSEKWDIRDCELLKAFREKSEKENYLVTTLGFGPSEMTLRSEKIEIYPFESLA